MLLCGAVVLAGLFFWKKENSPADGSTGNGEEKTQGQKLPQKGSDWEEISGAGDVSGGSAEDLFLETTPEQEPSSVDGSRYGALLSDPERMRQENVYAIDGASADEVTLLFAGDILFDEQYAVMAHLNLKGEGIPGVISEDLLTLMRSADVFMVNNEFPYSDRGTPQEEKQFTFRAKPETSAYLRDMGVDVVSLANNHVYDYGTDALFDTFSTLQDAQVAYVGAGKDIAEASRAVYFVVNDFKVGILSATQIEKLDRPDTPGATESTPGVFRCWNVEPLLAQIKQVKENCDYLVVHVHWGNENEVELDWAQEEQVVKIAEAGADLIVGDHPHCLQEIGRVRGVPVVYSLGNFWFNSKELDTGLLLVTLDPESKEVISMQFVPAQQKGCQTYLLHGSEKERVLSYMRGLSGTVTIDNDGFFK